MSRCGSGVIGAAGQLFCGQVNVERSKLNRKNWYRHSDYDFHTDYCPEENGNGSTIQIHIHFTIYSSPQASRACGERGVSPTYAQNDIDDKPKKRSRWNCNRP